ncbi:MAG: glycosyltransferase family 2 protein, partial [Candidatus Diapherotrites archaeon]|nr:glycosyltransferase family 2 protein [Candidatus Diapherotrites archaeon]
MPDSVFRPLIVIPAFNEEDWVGRTIDILRQEKPGVELVVINDGSTDKTREVALAHGVKVVDMPKNVGKANAFFAGVRYAIRSNASAVLFMDADLLKAHTGSVSEMLENAHLATLQNKSQMWVAKVREGKPLY